MKLVIYAIAIVAVITACAPRPRCDAYGQRHIDTNRKA